ncbi:hypothetical protein [Sinomonas humi]|uniref:Uncharacterized protein n=1 Tax=Sinomonas humi TaxID=1338436 RepID=A0A0B2AA05_9MICC|nr:hypothetical protein [Sinomonas humi]KHL00334.1 hypothetical protein LK10_20500 [Sinomonas humi]
MPWWFWILLWAALLAGSAVMAAVGGFWLVRKALRVFRDAGSSFGHVVSSPPRTNDAGEGARPGTGQALAGSAVFARPDEVRRVYEQGKAERREARRARRVARRTQRGQAQSLRDLGLI